MSHFFNFKTSNKCAQRCQLSKVVQVGKSFSVESANAFIFDLSRIFSLNRATFKTTVSALFHPNGF